MKTLLTGATGRIGKKLIKALKEKNHQITVLVLPGEKRLLENFDVEIYEGHIEDKAIYKDLLVDFDYVYHLAGVLPFNMSNDKIFEINIKGTYNILEAILENGIKLKRFIFASSDEVYPSLKPKYLPLDENHPRNPYSLYGLSKAIGEDLCNLYYREFGIPTVCPRFTYTIEANELLDPKSGVCSLFFIESKLNQLKSIKNKNPEVEAQVSRFEELFKKHKNSLYITYDKATKKPYRMPICDVRDLVEGLLALLENDEVIGESIGIGPPSSGSFDSIVKYFSKKLDIPFIELEVESPMPFIFDLNISKAKRMLSYNPEWDIYKMIDDAIKCKDFI